MADLTLSYEKFGTCSLFEFTWVFVVVCPDNGDKSKDIAHLPQVQSSAVVQLDDTGTFRIEGNLRLLWLRPVVKTGLILANGISKFNQNLCGMNN